MLIYEDQSFTGNAKALGEEILRQLGGSAASVEVLPIPTISDLTLRIWDDDHCKERNGH